jgi:hypothetical protein
MRPARLHAEIRSRGANSCTLTVAILRIYSQVNSSFHRPTPAAVTQVVIWLPASYGTRNVIVFTSVRQQTISWASWIQWPTQPAIQWVPGSLTLGVKRSGPEADNSPPSSAEVKEWMVLYLHSFNTPSWRGAYLSPGITLPFTFSSIQCTHSQLAL